MIIIKSVRYYFKTLIGNYKFMQFNEIIFSLIEIDIKKIDKLDKYFIRS